MAPSRGSIDARARAAVHEARKRVKKVRAILKLLKRPLGRHYATPQRSVANGGAATLQPARRRRHAPDLCDAVHEPRRHPDAANPVRRAAGLAPPTTRPLATGCEVREPGAPRLAPRRAQRAERIQASGADIGGGGRLRSGLPAGPRGDGGHHDGLRRGRFHRWRRRVKDLWYQVRLFAPRHRTLSARVEACGVSKRSGRRSRSGCAARYPARCTGEVRPRPDHGDRARLHRETATYPAPARRAPRPPALRRETAPVPASVVRHIH